MPAGCGNLYSGLRERLPAGCGILCGYGLQELLWLWSA